ncbi:hypothetical protein GUA87_04775 [Sneathiella sp. P13V-1]|uniref:hypothetical protein n=1 Tax=Sneathiella sp. P13V-1 TaxID=2697366 RepID=UPI00187B7939|nr:hypothetical protein [Sneathiella sp. P13V-1]MBE7636147.1 hypothetical protein [Sneathiella sp. P13V-1]
MILVRNLITYVVGVISLFVFANTAIADGFTLQLDEQTISYTLPEGYCLLDPANNPKDKVIWDEANLNGNGRKTVFRYGLMDCESLKEMRTGSEEANFILVALAVSTTDGSTYRKLPEGASNGWFFNKVRPRINKGIEVDEEANSYDRINTALSRMEKPDTEDAALPMGVFEESEEAIYAGIYSPVVSGGETETLASIMSFFPADRHILVFVVSQRFEGIASYMEALKTSKQFTRGLLRQNGLLAE